MRQNLRLNLQQFMYFYVYLYVYCCSTVRVTLSDKSTESQETVCVKATMYCPVLLNGRMNLILYILSHIVCVYKYKNMALQTLIFHSYRLLSPTSIYTVCVIYLSLWAVWLRIHLVYIMAKCLWFYRNISLGFFFWHRYMKWLSKMTLWGVH